jgi:hypothetical protein
MRNATTTLVLATALLGWTTTASAQEAEKPAASADAAEEAFLKAYFAERELKDYAAAEKQYAALASSTSAQASREVVARALVGRARCLLQMKRADEAGDLFARVEKEFAEFGDVAAEARAARQASEKSGGSLAERIRTDLEYGSWREDAWKYGERGVPALVELLRDESPELVFRAAETLAHMSAAAGHDALADAVDGRIRCTYPDQVRDGAVSGYASLAAARRLSTVEDDSVRRASLERLVYAQDSAAIDAVMGDAVLRRRFIQSSRTDELYGKLLLTALGRGGEARDDAITRIAAEPLPTDVTVAFFDPPAAVLADPVSLAAIAPVVHARWRATSNRRPSPELLAALTRVPDTASIGLSMSLEMKRPSADPAALVAAIERFGLGDSVDRELATALGPKPAPDLLRRVAAAWPEYRDWQKESNRLPRFLSALFASGVTDEASLLAFQEGLRPDGQLHSQFVYACRDARPRLGAWTLKAYMRELTLPTGREAHDVAAQGLQSWWAAFGATPELEARVPELVAALGEGGSERINDVLGAFRARSIEALKSALPTHPRKAVVAESLATLGDKSSADAVARVLAETSDLEDERARNEALESAVAALVLMRGDGAKDAVAAAMLAHGGRDAGCVLEILGSRFAAKDRFGPKLRFELCMLALEKCPGALRDQSDAARSLPPEMDRLLAIAALKSSSVEDRQWGADQEKELLDPAAWDGLLAAAQDVDVDLRDTAREALRAIRAKENELAEFKAMGEEISTRKRIETLLASKSDEQRRAGVAAIVATGLTAMVNELIRLAAEDESDNVRDDARKALLAMAKPATPAPPPATEKK